MSENNREFTLTFDGTEYVFQHRGSGREHIFDRLVDVWGFLKAMGYATNDA